MTETEQMDNTMPVTSARSKAASDGNTRLMWWWGIGFGLFGMALLLERTGSLVAASMPSVSQYISQGLPIPTSVFWQRPLTRLLYALGSSLSHWTVLWWLLLAASPFIMFYILQPNRSFFQTSEGGSPDEPLQRHLSVLTILRVLILSPLSLWIVGGVWWAYATTAPPSAPPLSAKANAWMGGVYFWLSSAFKRPGVVCLLWLVASGTLLFVLWQGGFHPRRLLSAALRGLAAGLLSACVLFSLFRPAHPYLVAVMRSVGTSGEKLWHHLALGSWLIGIVGFIALGMATYMIARPQFAWQERRRFLPLSVGTLLLIALLQWGIYARVIKGRWDFGKDYHPAIFGVSRKQAQQKEPDGRTLLVLGGRRFGVGVCPLLSVVGIEKTQRTEDVAWRYLRERNFRTSLSDEAFIHLHDCASLDWDAIASLEVDFANIERCPTLVATSPFRRPTFVDLLLGKLSACPITPETRRYLDKLADKRFFQHPTTVTIRIVGDLYRKFGDRKKAAEWYRKANVAPNDIAGVLRNPPLVTNGIITGSISINGKPAAGLRVGVVKWGNRFELMGPQIPFAQRHIVAGTTTDAEGKFTLKNLPAELYALVIAASSKRIPPNWAAIQVQNLPGQIDIGPGKLSRDVGHIPIEIDKNAPPSSRPTPPPPTGQSGGAVET